MLKLLTLLLLLSACATMPTDENIAGKTAMLWADMATPGYAPPIVETVSATEMAALRKSSFTIAAYFCRERKMVIIRDHATNDVWLSGILVHELVHHKQCVEGRLNGRPNMCLIEVEAYQAQIEWLREQGGAGFIAGTNARNYAHSVEKYMRQNFSQCL